MRNLNCDYLPTILITYQSIDQSISWVLCDCSLWRVSLFWVQFFEDSDRLIKLTVVNEADDHRQRMKVRSRWSRLQNHAVLLSLNHISSTWLTVLSSPLLSPRLGLQVLLAVVVLSWSYVIYASRIASHWLLERRTGLLPQVWTQVHLLTQVRGSAPTPGEDGFNKTATKYGFTVVTCWWFSLWMLEFKM